MIRLYALAASILFSTCALAAPTERTAGEKGCLVYHSSDAVGISAKWTGPCKDGFADGEGKLEWSRTGVREWTYEGGMRGGRFHGVGYMSATDNSQFEGTFVDGYREGFGISVNDIGDRYDGNWKDGMRDGEGKMVYALGGSYEGQWQQGLYHGKGTIVYAGGRRAEYQFDRGNWAERPAYPDAASLPAYSLKSHEAVTGSKFKADLFCCSPVPFEPPYHKMSEVQKKAIHMGYPLMDVRDEPPYPLDGKRHATRLIIESARAFGARGQLTVIVKVNSEGRGTTVTSIGSPHPKMTNYVSQVLLLDRYKPAMCAGTPCAGTYAFFADFGVLLPSGSGR